MAKHVAHPRRRGGDIFESRPDTAAELKKLRMDPTTAI